jgi:ribulose-phosphate 3-epimerase
VAVLVAPSLLSADFGRVADEARAVEQGGADWLHLDVMDGHFVPNITFGARLVGAVRKATRLPLDLHLMIERPELHVPAFVDAGATYVTVHVEATRHLHRLVQQIRDAGARPGAALNPATPVSALEDILPDLDLVLVMSVNPGWGGQAFIRNALDKVAAVRRALDARGLRALVSVDGGVKPENARGVARAGADVLVAGSAVFESADYAATIAEIRRQAEA